MTGVKVVRPRLPLDDLLTLTHAAAHDVYGNSAPVALIADVTGVNRRSVHRWAKEGGIPVDRADDVACAFGKHPSEVWGAAYYDAADEFDRRIEERREDMAGARYVLGRIHVSWWEADARRVLNEEWAA